MPLPTAGPASTGLTITNPLILYRALLATKVIDPDPSQHRLALELQKLYIRLKDYSPSIEYGPRLKAISRLVDKSPKDEDHSRSVAVPGHPLRRNPLFSHLFREKQDRGTTALTRGFLLHGEVGTGKSMLVDLLAGSLPNRKKRRWHFNTFMLETLARLEQLRQSRSVTTSSEGDVEHSLIWLAKDMVEKSPILFLDEFQLPDRAASKILSNLCTTFFQLGGVLVATSNRMPDELSKASGMDFSVPPRGGFVKSLLGIGTTRPGILSDNEYGGFVEVLKARCEVWNMEGGRDWRRREAEETSARVAEIAESLREEMVRDFLASELSALGELPRSPSTQQFDTQESVVDGTSTRSAIPKKYFLTQENEETWHQAIQSSFPPDTPNDIPWEPATLQIYGRTVPVPRQHLGVTIWNFISLCGTAFGPADYITLASTFHTLILTDVPILALSQKNEARRLITLLDALYEARCKLLIRAAAGPDELFFPETRKVTTREPGSSQDENEDGGDAVYPETLSEIYQDQTSPFRPNISSYTPTSSTKHPFSLADSDSDSDFGPQGSNVDFAATASFTGEDERFAYKRARSRLWEMCGGRWHARSGDGWWKPVPVEVRRWEVARGGGVGGVRVARAGGEGGDVRMGEAVVLDKLAGLQGREIEERERRGEGRERS